MKTIMIQLITAWIGSLGFGMIFRLRKQLLFPASLGGMICWGIYLLGSEIWTGIFFPTLIASACATLYAECLARAMKAPATIFLIPAVVPLIPGSTLYYTMSYAVRGILDQSGIYGMQTLLFALGISGGMCLIWAIFEMRPKKYF